MTRYEIAPVPTKVNAAPRYYLRTVGPRYHVIDDATGYAVAAYWTREEAVAALAAATKH